MNLPDTLLYLPFIATAIFFLLHSRKKTDKLGIQGKLIFIDKGKSTKPFFNNRYKVLGKPDLMYKQKAGVLAVEYKSRNASIYESDIVQAKAASLAARGAGYKVNRILIKTKKREKYITLPISDRVLHSQIKAYMDMVRDAAKGKALDATASSFKCASCAYVNDCEFKSNR